MTMSSSKIPPKSQQDIEDFLTFLAEAKSNPKTQPELWSNLQFIVQELSETEDKPAQLATVIKQWCQKYGITEEYRASLRVNMVPNSGDKIPQKPPGERPGIVSNQAAIVATVQDAIAHNKSDRK
jgi:hypothetical protein